MIMRWLRRIIIKIVVEDIYRNGELAQAINQRWGCDHSQAR